MTSLKLTFICQTFLCELTVSALLLERKRLAIGIMLFETVYETVYKELLALEINPYLPSSDLTSPGICLILYLLRFVAVILTEHYCVS